MPKYGVDITPETSIEFDVAPGVGVLTGADLDFSAETEDELRRLVERLGFDPAEMDPTKDLHCRYNLPLTCDGDRVGGCTINLWLRGELKDPAPRPPIAALARLVDEGKAARALEARRKAAETSVAWAQGVGRPVELRDGEVVERG